MPAAWLPTNSAFDSLLLLEVYSAGEAPIAGADGRSLCGSIRNRGLLDPIFVEDINSVAEVLQGVMQPGDVVLTQGAGSVGLLAAALAASQLKSVGTGLSSPIQSSSRSGNILP